MQVSVTWNHREQPFWPSDHPVVAKVLVGIRELKCGSLTSSCPFWSYSPSTQYEPSLHRSRPCLADHRHSHGHCALMQALLPVGTPGSCCSRPTCLCPGRLDSVDCVTGPPFPQLTLAGVGVELSVLQHHCCRDSPSRPPAAAALGPGQLTAPTVAPPLLAPSPTHTDWPRVKCSPGSYCASCWTVTTHWDFINAFSHGAGQSTRRNMLLP